MAISVKSSGGGGLSSTDVTASSAQVLAGYTALTTDSSDEAKQGTIQEWAGDLMPPPHLCFTANATGSTIGMTVKGTPTLGQNFQYSTDVKNWVEFTPGSTTITLANIGDKVYFKGDNLNGISEDWNTKQFTFTMSGSIAASGNIMSLIDNGQCEMLLIPNDYCFKALFKDCRALTSPPDLPATTLKGDCYRELFSGCTTLASAPVLPAINLKAYCYGSMFKGCTALTSAPVLPATTMNYKDGCYSSMFENCTELTTAPELPAMDVSGYCYSEMFRGCTKLIAAPALPAENINSTCYTEMFRGCTSLVFLPKLPAAYLGDDSYEGMFYGCESLQVSDTQTEDAPYAWRIPTTGSFGDSGFYPPTQDEMFAYCAGVRSSDDLPAEVGHSYTYYTQNPPV